MSITASDTYELREERLRDFILGWQQARPRDVDTGEPSLIQDLLREAFRRLEPVPLWSVPGRGMRKNLKRPLPIRIYREGDLVFAVNEELVIIGSGATPDEAVAEFVNHLLHFAEEYRGLPHDRVTGDAVRLKALFEDLFEE